jgi:hypothetical protein
MLQKLTTHALCHGKTSYLPAQTAIQRKVRRNVPTTRYTGPTKQTPFYYLTYKEGGLVSCRDALEEPSKSKIQATIDLVGLDRTPPDGGAEKDRRWKNRREAWDIAVESKQDLGESDSSAMRRQVVRTAVAQGYWSVWMTVFHDDTDILSKLIQGFVGTGADCFDPAGNYSAIETVRV